METKDIRHFETNKIIRRMKAVMQSSACKMIVCNNIYDNFHLIDT